MPPIPNRSTGLQDEPSAQARGFERIVLTGFMGSGKTTVGRLLARRLDWEFLDLDAAIERSAGRSVPAIFAERGEPEFRRLESAALTEALVASRLVLALGGGAPEAPANRKLLAEAPNTAVVHLSAPFSTLIERCFRQAQEPGATFRPVLADAAEAEQRFSRRESFYASIATHVVDTDRRTPSETLDAVLKLLAQKNGSGNTRGLRPGRPVS